MNKRAFRVIFFLLILAVLGYAFAFHTNYFKIKSIKVVGNQILSYNDIKEISKIQAGTNIFKVNPKQVEKNLLENPYIKECKVKILYPNRVEIFVEERRVVAQVRYKSDYLKIDKEGVIVEKGSFTPDLLLIEGIKVERYQIGKKLNGNFDKTLLSKVLGLIESKSNYYALRYIKEDEVELLSKQGINIFLKNPADVNYSFKFAELILKDLLKKGYKSGKIEIIGDGNAVFMQ
ncbi:MAG: FtsQ-type POTRA domain-containing protein [Caldanaerobacter subterraneus]|nr:FtsQ-type POTRA domain-containing protein [Caldanaerobacter subterraneus]